MIQVTATDGDKDRPQNIVYFLTGQGIDPDNPANSKFDINRTTGEIFVLKVSFFFVSFYCHHTQLLITLTNDMTYIHDDTSHMSHDHISPRYTL